MYIREDHAERDLPVLHEFVRNNPLGILITAIRSESPEHSFIQTTHLPLVLDTDGSETPDHPGILRGHFARKNPQAKVLMEAQARAHEAKKREGQDVEPHEVELDEDVLVLFNGPFHHYVTPHFYTETKPQTGKVVPTWNYSAVQAYGKARIFSDSKSEATISYLQAQIEDLTNHAEGAIMRHATDGNTGGDKQAWLVDDAPKNYIDIMKKNIIGIEIRLEKLEGRYKMSQELGVGDREGVIRGFENLGTEVGDGIAKTVKERGQMKKPAK